MFIHIRNAIKITLISTLISGCGNLSKKEIYSPPKTQNLSGKVLANNYCGNCHQVPNPSSLEKSIWEKSILPKMAYRLGMNQDYFSILTNLDTEEMQLVLNAGIYPEHPQLTEEDWKKITDYYLKNAPIKSVPQISKTKVKIGLSGFTVEYLKVFDKMSPRITSVKFDQIKKEIFVAWGGGSNFIKKYNSNFLETDSIAVQSPVSDFTYKNNSFSYLAMGIMNPSDKAKGSLVEVTNTKKKTTILNALKRPVQMCEGDLNQDKVEDVLVCNFGNEQGNLTWYEGGSNSPHLLKAQPGARVAYLKDMNNDKLLDIVVLMTQAREGVSIFFNKGKGDFDEKIILQFPSVYGSSFMSLVDFNKDGFQDILYTNGDNADLSYSLKAYHGIRIFLNDGKNNFKQMYFYPMHGASKALAADFDRDGDLDIAAISFFTDPNQKPNEGFLLLKNNGNLQFDALTIKESKTGKWMVMDVGDMDKDGDDDIIIGSFLGESVSKGNGFILREKKPPAVIILENNSVK
jgi:hypothetical protein